MPRVCRLGTDEYGDQFLACPWCGQLIYRIEEPQDVWLDRDLRKQYQTDNDEFICPRHAPFAEDRRPGGGRFVARRLPCGIMSRALPLSLPMPLRR